MPDYTLDPRRAYGNTLSWMAVTTDGRELGIIKLRQNSKDEARWRVKGRPCMAANVERAIEMLLDKPTCAKGR